jgi:hypothetical protein
MAATPRQGVFEILNLTRDIEASLSERDFVSKPQNATKGISFE